MLLSVLGTINEVEPGNWAMVDYGLVNPEAVKYGPGGENSCPKAFAVTLPYFARHAFAHLKVGKY